LNLAYTSSLLIPDPDTRARALSAVGAIYYELYEASGTTADLDRAIVALEEAMQHTSRAEHLDVLGISLRTRFNKKGDIVDIERAIELHENALGLTDDGDPDKPARFSYLGVALQNRFNRLGSLVDIKNAILINQKAVDLTLDGDPDKPARFSNLGSALQTRFNRLGNLVDIKNAILAKQKTVDLTPDGHPDKPRYFSNLGNAFQTLFNRLGNLTDMENAILSKQKAADLTPDGHSDMPVYLSNLGTALQTRFNRLGTLVDIKNAIFVNQKAADLTPDGHPNKPTYLSNLGLALQARFHRLGILSDLGNAILSKQKAVDLTPDGHPDEPYYLSALGSALSIRFGRLGNLSDIENAILSNRKAVDLTPDGHSSKPVYLSNLGTALQTRFNRIGTLVDIENAILINQKAVDLTLDGHPRKPRYLSNLGNALRARFNRLESSEDIESAISSNRKAVELTPDGHPDKPGRLFNLGNSLLRRLRYLHNLEDLEDALSAYSQAAKSPIGSPINRFRAARAWAKRSDEYSRSSLSAYSCAVDLLPRIAWLGLPVTDQHALLTEVGEIARNAVSAAIRWEQLETAVEWAEQGRSIVWQNMLGLRTPVDDLRAKYPALASRIRDIAQQIEAPISHDTANANITSLQLATDWEDSIEEIRRLPGFEGFLKAKTFSQLAPVAYEGPVVILNVDKSRCDALILIADDRDEKHVSVIDIPLTRFSHETAQKLYERLTELLKTGGVRARGEMRKTGRLHEEKTRDNTFKNILRILWQDVIHPVIDALAYKVCHRNDTGVPTDTFILQAHPEHLGRIWWCATGSLAFLPIHAAGLYGPEVEEKLSDYVVSSYTPTLTAILGHSTSNARDDFTLLTIAQPATPNAMPIPETEGEVKQVHGLAVLAGGVKVVSLINEEATVERVLQEMGDADWVHLACHGKQQTGDPMKSGLLLDNDVLELSEIVRHSFPRADFAFLSACETAVGDEKIADESVHLAAGMFMAGYRGVIATMWAIKDKDAPQVAQDVYERMLKNGQPDRKEAAYGLHNAVKRLRESGTRFMGWVPFIHLGR